MMTLGRMLELGDFIHPMALRREVYSRVYYPGTTNESEAMPLDLAPGAVLAGIDLKTAVAPAR